MVPPLYADLGKQTRDVFGKVHTHTQLEFILYINGVYTVHN